MFQCSLPVINLSVLKHLLEDVVFKVLIMLTSLQSFVSICISLSSAKMEHLNCTTSELCLLHGQVL